jgi:hypothetical protein
MSQATIAATSKIAEMKEKEEVKQRSSDGTEVSTDWTSQATSVPLDTRNEYHVARIPGEVFGLSSDSDGGGQYRGEGK